MNEEELKQFWKRGKIATRKWRLELSTALHASDNPETPKTSRYSDMYPYTTAASFGKARRKVQCALPKSPRKSTAVLANLAQDLQVKFIQKVSPNALNAAVKTAVIEFYNNDFVSRMTPGKADFVTLRQEDGSKEKRHKRHLVMMVGETYEEFKRENPDTEIGKSTFASLRPKYVLLNSSMQLQHL